MNAIYLLAYCYYRRGSPKSARSVLLNRGGSGLTSSSSSSSDATTTTCDTVELERTRSSARYLLAKSCYDLGLYSEAEETLLRHCRETFAKAVSDGGGIVNGVKIRGNRNEAMDAWIVQSSSAASSSPCPIPNGSAGLYLLGNICRKTNRRQRAIEYYRLSLKLDPLMWTSYEAICELAGSEGKEDEADDPNTIFGVEAPLLSPRHGGEMMGGGGGGGVGGHGHGLVNARVNNESTASGASGHPQQQQQQHRQSLHSFQLNRYGTPSTPYSTFGDMKLTGTQSSVKQGFGVNFHLPATASTVAPRTRGDREGDSLPQTNLFAATPAIEETPAGRLSASETPNDGATPPASAIGYANQVLDRARRVVAGLTYEPSPESVQHPGTHRKASTNRPASADLTFSSTPMPTSSGATPAPFQAGVSTVKGEKRALFATTDEGDDGNDGTSMSRKKTPKKEEATKDQMEGTAEMSNAHGNATDPITTPGPGNAIDQLDGFTESQHVGKVLELLCCLGAAYKYLCQVSSVMQFP